MFAIVSLEMLDAVIASGGGRMGVVGNIRTGNLTLWNAKTFAKIISIDPLDGNPVTALDFSPDGKKLATASTNGALKIWDVQSLVKDKINDNP